MLFGSLSLGFGGLETLRVLFTDLRFCASGVGFTLKRFVDYFGFWGLGLRV